MEVKRGYKYDPVEDTPEYKAIEEELHAKILERMGGEMNRGNAHLYPVLKKEILKNCQGFLNKHPERFAYAKDIYNKNMFRFFRCSLLI